MKVEWLMAKLLFNAQTVKPWQHEAARGNPWQPLGCRPSKVWEPVVKGFGSPYKNRCLFVINQLINSSINQSIE